MEQTNVVLEKVLDELKVAKVSFQKSYDDVAFKDLRWNQILEGLFVDRLEVLTREEAAGRISAHDIGEFVINYFCEYLEEGAFDL